MCGAINNASSVRMARTDTPQLIEVDESPMRPHPVARLALVLGRGRARLTPHAATLQLHRLDHCNQPRLSHKQAIQEVKPAAPWSGNATINPYHTYGTPDSFGHWAGWVYAADADTGVGKWRLKSNYPILGGMTPTAGGVAFFGDMGGNFYAVDSLNGQRLWGIKMDGAIGGGVITYESTVHRKSQSPPALPQSSGRRRW
ncbi:MAG: PQQ-binding-like beta-propeller repeat protein [Caldimonas sp.]